ncbi:hypothetical protein [Edaphobacter albus]|uniref:hypothetical protein n=1 Tax=Edaphobacter sp. 4G125 TaxID=2763071 RepID=UPI00164418E1|nr:hypothetical protein [Edaphobacter sp. 4G125]QNI36393.1 hypothetical protein H7846_15705 [Edaphobacter sp. 4G125]
MPLTCDAGSTGSRARKPAEEQLPEKISSSIADFLLEYPAAVILEDGRVVFDMRSAKYRLDTEHGRCTLHLWSEEANFVRRVMAAERRKGSLRLSVLRFGQTRSQTLEIVAERERRTPSTREATRVKYLRVLARVLARAFPHWKVDGLRTAMDLEKSFGPEYARGVLVQGQSAWAVIAVNPEETQATIDGILTIGILWLEHCRSTGDGRRVWQGLKVIVPQGAGTLTATRMRWLNPRAAQWELWELDSQTEELEPRETNDTGNIATRLIHAPDHNAVRERFAMAIERVMSLVPEAMRMQVEIIIANSAEVLFLLHGLEFARIRAGYAGNSFNVQEAITFGAGANETALTSDNEGMLRELVARLFERRQAEGDKRDPLYRMQPERWLESVLRRDLEPLDAHLDARHVYTQVPAFVGGDRGMLDLLGVLRDGRLAVMELKAEEDLHLALQGLDYWIRVRWHHLCRNNNVGSCELQRAGYFGGVVLSPLAPKLYLVAPALRVHPATEIVLRYLSPEVDWELVALDERWRRKVKAVWRKRSTDRREV